MPYAEFVRLVASMGPPTNVDGEPPAGSMRDLSLARFNGAADKRRRRAKGSSRPLVDTGASMGPPTNVDGEDSDARSEPAWELASMGPPTNVDGEVV